MSDIRSNIEKIRKTVEKYGREVSIMAVTKTFPVEAINEAVDCGITLIGENRVQELLSKYDGIKDRDRIKIHLIGHLQKNKVKYIIGKVDMIESVDSLELAEKISDMSLSRGLVTEILVQLNMGSEENKFGIAPDETESFLRAVAPLRGIKVMGLMGVVPIETESTPSEKYFSQLYNIFLDIKGKNIDNINMDIISMGMSNDYETAVKCGSNLVRIGSAIFGKRDYKIS